MQPFLRWAGSKRKSLPQLMPYWNAGYSRYVEPFAGSACLFFGILPESAYLSDINLELINTYRMIRLDPSLVVEAIKRLLTGREAYYRIRALRLSKLTEVERAARLIYLNQYCFNGLYRTNKSGHFNVPFGNRKGTIFKDFSAIYSASSVLRGCRLECADFEETLDNARKGDFVYLDPPYFTTEKRVFGEYDLRQFTSTDLGRLTKSLIRLDKHKVAFLMSYDASDEAEFLFSKWRTRRIPVQRNIAGFVGSRKVEHELLITNIEGMVNG
jgi:DNA adenine methylase